jgi:hypothetical protein
MTPANSPIARRFAPWLILLGAIAVPLVYLPTLHTRFDFIDDGDLVYAATPMPLGARLHLVWEKIVANYEHLGPFRPALWAHWELAAELCHGDAARWRLVRMLWSGVSVAALLALLRELRIRPEAALFVAALAFWNPYRNEIWTSLTLSEGVAMPYALAALWCAARANRSKRAWPWDVGSVLGVIAALGCKNVFAALVPAQVYVRIYADGAGWREGIRAHGKRAALLSLTLLLPIAHYIYFVLHWHEGQYLSSKPTLVHLGQQLRSLAGAESIDFLGPGFGLAIVALWMGSHRPASGSPDGSAWTCPSSCQGMPTQSRGHGTPVLAGLLLLTAGLAAYLRIPGISGRYTMPGVWGLDLLLAAVLSKLAAIRSVAAKRVAWVGLIGGLAIVAGASIGRQEKFATRAAVLWDTLEYVEATAPPSARVAWYSSAALNEEEGIHFQWHLNGRGHALPLELFDEHGTPMNRCELPATVGIAGLAITGTPEPPPGGDWQLRRAFHRAYWGGRRAYDCYLWGTNG